MTELTVLLDEGVTESLEQMAREKAVPLNTLVAESLADLAERHKARTRLRELLETSTISLDADWKWDREDIYERAVLRRHQRGPLCDDGTSE